MHICIQLWVWEYSLKIFTKHELLFDIVLIYVLVFSSEIYSFYAVIYNFKYPSRLPWAKLRLVSIHYFSILILLVFWGMEKHASRFHMHLYLSQICPRMLAGHSTFPPIGIRGHFLVHISANSSPTPQKSYPKFQNPRTTLHIIVATMFAWRLHDSTGKWLDFARTNICPK